MVDLSTGLSGMTSGVSMSGLLNGLKWFLIIVLVAGLIGYITYYFLSKKKYKEYRVEILDKDSNDNVYKTFDKGGVFLDKKTGNRLLFIEKAKVGLNPNNIPYISTIDNKGRLIKTVTLRRIGVNNYVFVHVSLGDKIAVTIGEEDLNNAAQEMNKIRRTYDKKSWLDKLLAPIIFIVTIMIIMIILLTLFNKFAIIKDVSSNMLEITKEQKIITGYLLNMTNQTIQENKGYATIIKPSGT